MAFVSKNATCSGPGYSGNIHTVQDFQADSTGNTIYAEGEVTVVHQRGVYRIPETIYQNNRSLIITNGQKQYRPPFYKQKDADVCLYNLIQRMHMLGRTA